MCMQLCFTLGYRFSVFTQMLIHIRIEDGCCASYNLFYGGMKQLSEINRSTEMQIIQFTCPSMHPELPEQELVSSSAARASSPSAWMQSSLSIFGVSGSLKFIGGGGDGVLPELLFGNNGHVDASSSGKNVEQDGDVFSDWTKSTPNRALPVDISKLLIVFYWKFDWKFMHTKLSREKNISIFLFVSEFYSKQNIIPSLTHTKKRRL